MSWPRGHDRHASVPINPITVSSSMSRQWPAQSPSTQSRQMVYACWFPPAQGNASKCSPAVMASEHQTWLTHFFLWNADLQGETHPIHPFTVPVFCWLTSDMYTICLCSFTISISLMNRWKSTWLSYVHHLESMSTFQFKPRKLFLGGHILYPIVSWIHIPFFDTGLKENCWNPKSQNRARWPTPYAPPWNSCTQPNYPSLGVASPLYH